MKYLGVILALVFFSSCNAGKYYFNKRINHDENFAVQEKVEIAEEIELTNIPVQEPIEMIEPNIVTKNPSTQEEIKNDISIAEPTQKTEQLSKPSDALEEKVSGSIIKHEYEVKTEESTEIIFEEENPMQGTKEKGEYMGLIVGGGLLLLFLAFLFVQLGSFSFVIIGYILLVVLAVLCLIGLFFALDWVWRNV